MCTTCAPACDKDQTPPMVPEPINLTDQYKTREGRNVRVICIDRKDPVYKVVALYTSTDGSSEGVLTSLDKFGQVPEHPAHPNGLVKVDPLADFRNLPLDTPVMVRTTYTTAQWNLRYWRSLETGSTGNQFTTWDLGKTSLTTDQYSHWYDARLATPEELAEARRSNRAPT